MRPPDLELAGRQGVLRVCPEVLGGLPTPRRPAAIVGGDGHVVLEGAVRILTDEGEDVTDPIVAGGRIVADEAAARGVREAVLQALSPTCGSGSVYDGTHTGSVTAGGGVLAAELSRRGIGVRARRGLRLEP